MLSFCVIIILTSTNGSMEVCHITAASEYAHYFIQSLDVYSLFVAAKETILMAENKAGWKR